MRRATRAVLLAEDGTARRTRRASWPPNFGSDQAGIGPAFTGLYCGRVFWGSG